ncbi:MAG: VanZ family protein [Alphaproteobacteria bacterium]|nr:VanZ family protein [Alphaproteobacteria bacterium]
MMQSKRTRTYLLVTVGIVAVILHGSLYPYDFTARNGAVGPVNELFRTWAVPPTGFGDLVANILLYIPFGFFAVLASRARAGLRVTVVTLLGLALCVGVELTQFYDAGRVTNMSDVYLNTLGTFIGALAGLVFDGYFTWPLLREVSEKPIPALLLVALLGYRLFPYVPTIDLHKYWDSLKPVFLSPSFSPYSIFHYSALWLVIAYITEAIAGQKKSLFLYPLVAGFVVVSKILIQENEVTLPELLGISVAFVVWAALVSRNGVRAAGIVTALFYAAVMAQRLEPFTLRAVAGHFGWMPFLSYMSGALEVNIESFFEKFFEYGGLIWLLTEMRIRLGVSTVFVAASLFVTSFLEIYLPDRSAEITDATIAILTGAIFAVVNANKRQAPMASPAASA